MTDGQLGIDGGGGGGIRPSSMEKGWGTDAWSRAGGRKGRAGKVKDTGVSRRRDKQVISKRRTGRDPAGPALAGGGGAGAGEGAEGRGMGWHWGEGYGVALRSRGMGATEGSRSRTDLLLRGSGRTVGGRNHKETECLRYTENLSFLESFR